MRTNSKPSEALFRKLKEELSFSGFSVVESFDVNNSPYLAINTDEASLAIAQFDAVSKDILGFDLAAAGPHYITFSSRDNAMSSLKVAKIIDAVSKKGCAQILIKTHATVLATAEASQPAGVIYADVAWKAHGV